MKRVAKKEKQRVGRPKLPIKRTTQEYMDGSINLKWISVINVFLQ